MEDWRQCSCPETGQAVDSQWDLPGLKAARKQTYSALHRYWAVYLELGTTTDMSDTSDKPYQETVTCDGRPDEGLIFIKVVAMPHEDAVEFDVTQARAFARQILSAIEIVESGWVGKSEASPDGGGA